MRRRGKVAPGEYTDEVVFQSKSKAIDELGGESEIPWEDVTEIMYGKLTPLSGRVRMWAQAEKLDITHELEVRYFPEFNATGMRVKALTASGTRYFAITDVVNEAEINRKLVITCREIFGES